MKCHCYPLMCSLERLRVLRPVYKMGAESNEV